MTRAPRIALTVDFEDAHHGLRIGGAPSTLQQDIEWILEVFKALDVHATFFVLGEVLESHPGLVRQVAAAGHEMATHGVKHEFLRDLQADEFRRGLKSTIAKLEDAVGARVLGFRAPFFSVESQTQWCLGILAECGLQYDASIYPGPNDRYGWSGAPTRPARHVPTGLSVFPVPLLHPRAPVAFSGGAYLRLLPHSVVRSGLQRQQRLGLPGMIYFHPWEISTHLPWRHQASVRANLTRHLLRGRMRPQLQQLLADTRSLVGPMRNVIDGLGLLPAWDPRVN